jgi:hypothetical protein
MPIAPIETVKEMLHLGTPKGLRLGEPERAGALTLMPVFHEGPAFDYTTYAEADAAKLVVVSEVGESGTVPNLLVENLAEVPLLLVAGEIFIGLKQNRVLNTTILVAAASRIPIPVSCVEQGRWRHASKAARRGDYHLSPAVRRAQARTVAENVRTGGEFRADQGQIWTSVGDALDAHDVSSETRAFTDVTARRGEEIRKRMASLRPKPGQAGVLAAVGGEPTCADVFDRATTMERLWEGLVGSYLTDALVGRDSEGDDLASRVEAWLKELADGEATEHAGVGLGRTVEITSPSGTLTALVVDNVVVHLAALPRA